MPMVRATTGAPSGGRRAAVAANRGPVEYGTDVVTPDDASGREPIDPVFAGLFRPEDLDPVEPQADVAPEPEDEPEQTDEPEFEQTDEPEFEQTDEPEFEHEPVDETVDEPQPAAPADAPAPAPAAADVDTGRLFRSQGVVGESAAVLALNSDHGGRLRTLAREQTEPPPAVVPTGAGPVLIAPDGAVITADAGLLNDAPVKQSRRERRNSAARDSGHRRSGISAGAVYIIVIGVTVIVGFVNAWLGGGELGWPTGVALVASSVYCALRVRRDDDVVAFITPPIAFFLAAITAGQAFRGASGGGLINRAQLVFFTLAYNWYWVIGATVVALVIVLVRRRR